MTNEYLSYQDVFLFPEYSPFMSRSGAGCSPSVRFGLHGFKVPVVPANMKCVIDSNLARWMSESGYFYIMHRFNVDHSHPVNQDNMEFVKRANNEKWKIISISIGVQDSDKDFLKWIVQNNYRVDYITIDIAHAHSIRMREMLEFVRKLDFKRWFSEYDILPDGRVLSMGSMTPISYHPFIIAGNVATPQAVTDLEGWGADSVKVGIAQGDACTTYGQTGFGLPMFGCIMNCAKVAKKPIIADGGIRMNGDFAKAIVAGGSMVMAGSIFAACKDSPAETVVKRLRSDEVTPMIKHGDIGPYVSCEYTNATVTRVFKKYYGSASEYNKGTKHHVEGRMVELPCNGMTYAEKFLEIEESLASSISYAGGNLPNARWGVIYK